MTEPLLDLAATRDALLVIVVLVLPAVLLGLVLLRAFLQKRIDDREQEFHERCRRIDAARWRGGRAA